MRQHYSDRSNILFYSYSRSAQVCDVELMRQLLSYEPDINALEKERRTPLMDAAENGTKEMVALLLEADAGERQEAFQRVFGNRQNGVAQVFLDAGGIDVNAPDVSDRLPLVAAVVKRDADLVWQLCKARAVVKGLKYYDQNTGNKLLQAAADDKEASLIIRKVLIDCGADINERNAVTGGTVLHVAIAQKHRCKMYLAKSLIEDGVDVTIKDWQGKTAKQLAAEKGLLGIVKVLENEEFLVA